MNENLLLQVEKNEAGYYYFTLHNSILGGYIVLPYRTSVVDAMKAQGQYYCDFFNCDSI
jgi:hypothetical protein